MRHPVSVRFFAGSIAVLIASVFSSAPAQGDASCQDPGTTPSYLCIGFWQQIRQLSDSVDGQSIVWVGQLAGALQDSFIQLAGTEDDANQNGVAIYSPSSSLGFVWVYCLSDPCSGFPTNHKVQIRVPNPNTYFPASSLDSPMVVLDHTNVNASTFVWLYQACPPGYTGNAWCVNHHDPTRWTATAMSSQKWNSSGLDGCWPNSYPSLYQSYDLPNTGHRGLPSSFTAIHYDDVEPPTGAIGHMLELSVPASVVNNQNYFPMAGRDSLIGTIPEGVILHLKSPSLIPDTLSAAAKAIAQALNKYGAVVSDTNLIGQAFLNVEALYIENPSISWNAIGVHRASLAGIPLDSDHFEFIKKGAPGFGGPTHQQWQPTDCENDPGP